MFQLQKRSLNLTGRPIFDVCEISSLSMLFLRGETKYRIETKTNQLLPLTYLDERLKIVRIQKLNQICIICQRCWSPS